MKTYQLWSWIHSTNYLAPFKARSSIVEHHELNNLITAWKIQGFTEEGTFICEFGEHQDIMSEVRLDKSIWSQS